MNEILIEAFHQKDWAMKVLIIACKNCSVEELTGSAAGFGSILATLNHLVLADAGYVASLGGGHAVWAVADSETNDLQELVMRVEENGASMRMRRVVAVGCGLRLIRGTRLQVRSCVFAPLANKACT